MSMKEIDKTTARLAIAKEGLDEVQGERLDVNKVMNQLIFGHPSDVQKECEFCQGEGYIEIDLVTKDESTGFNSILEGTGNYKKCFNCNHND